MKTFLFFILFLCLCACGEKDSRSIQLKKNEKKISLELDESVKTCSRALYLYTDKDGKTYDNVLVLELSNGEEQIIEIEDLIKIYKEEENATEVQITITKSTGPTDPNNPASDEPNIISAKLTDSVKADIAKGVEAHEGLSHNQSDVQLNYSEELGEHRVLLKDSIKTDIAKGVTAHNAIFDGTTTFVLNGGNASGYVVATDESTEV